MPGLRLDTRHALAIAVLLWVPAHSFQTSSGAQSSGVLPEKETLSYNVEWRLIDAGKARLNWNANSQPSHPGWQVNLHLESTGLVSKLYKVDDQYAAELASDLCVQNTHLKADRKSTRLNSSH